MPRLGLFSRSFLLIASIILASLAVWIQIVLNIEEGPRAAQLAQRIATTVSITRSALVYAPPNVRPALVLDLATRESLRIQPREANDIKEPLPNNKYWRYVSAEVRDLLNNQTNMMWSVNNTPGIWISFDIEDAKYWLVFDRDQLRLTTGREWLGWIVISLLLALIGAAISARFINRPLSRLAQVARQIASAQQVTHLPEKGPPEIREMNQAFNRMVKDIRENQADREIMLAGISHDLRTPLARMRLEIEMSNVDEEARYAIDQDLAQISHSIDQLMEYARPASHVPDVGIDVTSVLHSLFDSERRHTESLGGSLQAHIEPELKAKISANDLKRIVSNLIENARRYGHSQADDKPYIELRAYQLNKLILIDVQDQGPGIDQADIQRLLRPFARGETARTGVSGAGLGLSIVERLISQVNGKFSLISKPGEGLLARIALPKI